MRESKQKLSLKFTKVESVEIALKKTTATDILSR